MVVDIEAVRQARQGNQDSFAQVYQQIAEDLYRVALYSLGNAHDAQDVVSETLIKASGTFGMKTALNRGLCGFYPSAANAVFPNILQDVMNWTLMIF